MRVVLDCMSVILCLRVIQLCTGSRAGEAAGVAFGRPETSAAASDASAATAAAEADADAASVGPRTAVGVYVEFQEGLTASCRWTSCLQADIAGQHITKVPSVSTLISTHQQGHHRHPSTPNRCHSRKAAAPIAGRCGPLGRKTRRTNRQSLWDTTAVVCSVVRNTAKGHRSGQGRHCQNARDRGQRQTRRKFRGSIRGCVPICLAACIQSWRVWTWHHACRSSRSVEPA